MESVISIPHTEINKFEQVKWQYMIIKSELNHKIIDSKLHWNQKQKSYLLIIKYHQSHVLGSYQSHT